MRNKIIFCVSYSNIEPTLLLIENDLDTDIIIYTFRENVFKYLNSLDLKCEIIHINLRYTLLSKNPIKILKAYFDLKKAYSKYFNRIIGHDVYFFYKYYFVEGLFILHNLGKKNNIYLYNRDLIKDSPNNNNARSRLFAILIKKYLHIKVKFVKWPTCKYVPEITSDYIINNKIIVLGNMEINFKAIDKYNYTNSDVKVLFITAGLPESKIVDKKRYTKVYNNLLKVLYKKYLKKEVAVKMHPFQKTLTEPFDENIYKIPNYIPAEFCYLKSLEVVIGEYSSYLINITKNDNNSRKIKVFSTLYLQKFKRNCALKEASKYLESCSDGKIILLQSKVDFEKYI
jgi:hypothetical protein